MSSSLVLPLTDVVRQQEGKNRGATEAHALGAYFLENFVVCFRDNLRVEQKNIHAPEFVRAHSGSLHLFFFDFRRKEQRFFSRNSVSGPQTRGSNARFRPGQKYVQVLAAAAPRAGLSRSRVCMKTSPIPNIQNVQAIRPRWIVQNR